MEVVVTVGGCISARAAAGVAVCLVGVIIVVWQYWCRSWWWCSWWWWWWYSLGGIGDAASVVASGVDIGNVVGVAVLNIEVK